MTVSQRHTAPSTENPAINMASPLSTAAAEQAWSRDLTTRFGFRFHVRPARPSDEAALGEFFHHVTPEDLRHRFLVGLREVGHDRLAEMARNDDPHSLSFLAIEEDSGEVVATAMMVADADFAAAEFAISTRADRKHLGVSWTLLEHLVRYAQAVGIKRLHSIQCWDDQTALQLEREMGFTTHLCPDDATLIIAEKRLASLAPN